MKLRNARQLASDLGVSPGYIYAIKRAIKALGEPPIFMGNFSTVAKVTAWLEAHPTFRCAGVPTPQSTPQRPQALASSK